MMTSVNITVAGQHVVIQNAGSATGNLNGFALCQRPNYHIFDDIELAPGEFIAVSLGGDLFLPPPGAKETLSANLGSITTEDGEIGLYSSGDFGNSSAIVDYVEWARAAMGGPASRSVPVSGARETLSTFPMSIRHSCSSPTT